MVEHFTVGKANKICTFCFNGILTEDTRICNNCGKHNPKPKEVKGATVTDVDFKNKTITLRSEE